MLTFWRETPLKDQSFFIDGATFYKGNIHCHTILSDGELTPIEVVQAYQGKGYAFLGISDHERYFDSTEFDSENFLVYPAIEYAVEEPKDGQKGHHMHGILGTEEHASAAYSRRLRHLEVLEKIQWRSANTVQQAVDFLHNAGNLVIYNHPIWSRLELNDLINVSGLFAIEIFNWNCDVWDATGSATALWDQMLRRGKRVYGVATDDNHNNAPFDSPHCDSFGGWIVVAAERLSRDSIAQSLRQGSFYASTGPAIDRFYVAGNELSVACSPVQRINFVSYERRGSVKFAEHGGTLTGASHTLKGDEVFVRVECIDAFGKTAWSQPVFLEDIE